MKKRKIKVWVSPKFYKERSTIILLKTKIKVGNKYFDVKDKYIPAEIIY